MAHDFIAPVKPPRAHCHGGAADRPRRVLVVEDNPTARSVLLSLLRGGGFEVIAVPRPAEATHAVQSCVFPFDFILCEYHFHAHGEGGATGRDWLDQMRQKRAIPMTTSVVMITGESRYQCVADSVENALDDYLLKPYSGHQLHERLRTCESRKRALHSVYEAIDADNYELAAKLCEVIFGVGGKHRLAAARFGSELYLRLNQFDAAQRLLQAVIDSKALPWARLGLARVHVGTQQTKLACLALDSLISDEPSYPDAYDLLGRALVEDLQFARALEMYAKAVALTPGNVSRLQKLANLELFLGQTQPAFEHLSSAAAMGASSPAFDHQSLFQLALAGTDLQRPNAWERPLRLLEAAARKSADCSRLRILTTMTQVLASLGTGSIAAASSALVALMRESQDPAFDFELACNLLQLLARTENAEFRLDRVDEVVQGLGLRFAVSRQSLEMLVMASRMRPAFEPLLRQAFDRVSEWTRSAMAFLLTGQATSTIAGLLDVATKTHNGRVLAMARGSLNKHRSALGEGPFASFSAEVNLLQETYCAQGTHANPALRGEQRPSAV